jgi:hypothetical protein
MALEWTHAKCAKRACDGTTNCPGFPTVHDRINMAKAAYEEYSESDGMSVIDFALDVLLLAQSQHDADKTLLPRLAKQARREWAKSKRRCAPHPRRSNDRH